jgi:hypothetical protein
MATPNLKEGVVSVIDMKTWKTVKQIPTPGPGFFMRSHENSRYAWVDSMMSREHKDTLTVIDKQTLEVAAQLKPVPGKTLAHIEFTKDGKLRPGQPVGERRRPHRLRRRHPEGGQAHPDAKARSASTTSGTRSRAGVRGHQPLK